MPQAAAVAALLDLMGPAALEARHRAERRAMAALGILITRRQAPTANSGTTLTAPAEAATVAYTAPVAEVAVMSTPG